MMKYQTLLITDSRLSFLSLALRYSLLSLLSHVALDFGTFAEEILQSWLQTFGFLVLGNHRW
jgi:hypothetical protein